MEMMMETQIILSKLMHPTKNAVKNEIAVLTNSIAMDTRNNAMIITAIARQALMFIVVLLFFFLLLKNI